MHYTEKIFVFFLKFYLHFSDYCGNIGAVLTERFYTYVVSLEGANEQDNYEGEIGAV